MCNPIVFHHPFNHTAYLLVEQHVWSVIQSHRQQTACAPEAGGILLGLRRGEHIHVTLVTEPGTEDRRTRTAFHRARDSHQAHALQLWEESEGVTDYLGEWHTHPEEHPTPSTIDRAEWRKLLSSYRCPLMFLIAGTQTEMWIGVGQAGFVKSAQPIEAPRRVYDRVLLT